ncbi:hypothetical protein N658DRAFT_521719 [Parathielavia hyrcaniae]|uniref:Uncharacterized protein n=1 Tax=Parathielavia hyrcaniae TaxID=113614 RepID=A0AAN6Q5C5_9PEZI|nr:hypothetical protein N658DRAFT_521719 [Parathielavia hyrcaniae]
MSGQGLEILLEGLIPEIAYSGEKGIPITELLKIVRQYHLSLGGQDASTQGDAAAGLQGQVGAADLERTLTDAELASARWAWDWLRSRPQILINGNKRWNRLELSEALALPEAESIDPAIASTSGDANENEKSRGKKPKKTKTLTTRPRIHPSEDLVWQTLTRHGVDYKRVPALEWACLQGVASTRAEGILQSDLRRLVNQDKRSLPKRTDSLARKGYIAKRTVVVQKMKTSRLWLIDFAPPLVEEETCGMDLTPETLSKNLEPVPWHRRWTGNNIDMDALGRTVVGVVKAFHVMRYADLRSKMGVSGKRWQMKTLAKNCQRLVDVGVLKYTAASFPGMRKIFKDCLKFLRDPNAEEWEKFLATGKKTSVYSDPTRHREPKPNALALYGKSGEDGQGTGDARSKVKRIFSGWTPEKPLAQTVFEVIRRAGTEGASNPQVSVATIGYQHRRYLSSYLMKVAETQQPPHLKKFQVVSKLVRTGKTSAYMYSAPGEAALSQVDEEGSSRKDEQTAAESSSSSAPADPFGFGAVRIKAFSAGPDISLSEMSRVVRKWKPSPKRKLLPRLRREHTAAAELVPEATAQPDAVMVDQQKEPTKPGHSRPRKRSFGEMAEVVPEALEDGAVRSVDEQEQAPSSTIVAAANGVAKIPTDEDLVLNVQYNGIVGKLRVHRPDRNLSFLRSGRGLKKPFFIPIDDNLDDPAIRDVPGSKEKSLVLATGEKNGAPAWNYVFIFNDKSQENAGWIQDEVIKMKSPTYKEPTPVEPTPVSEGAAAPPEELTIQVAPPEPARSKARGREGAGGKGKGRKRQPTSGGAKPYVCSLCGGTWKNDIGLKYHLEKAQVPCNPNFDPAILLERSRKRRKPSPVPPSVANSEAGDDETLGRTRKPRRAKKVEKKNRPVRLGVRSALRSVQGPAHTFRGLRAEDAGDAEREASWVPERPKGAFRGLLSQPDRAQDSGLAALVSTEKSLLPTGSSSSFGAGTFSDLRFRPSTPAGTAPYPVATASAKHDASINAPTVMDEHAAGVVASRQRSGRLLSLQTAPATPSRSRDSEGPAMTGDALDHKLSSHTASEEFALPPRDRTPRPNRYGERSLLRGSPMPGHSEPPHSEYPDLVPQSAGEQTEFNTQTSTSQDDQVLYKPFVPTTNYDRMASEAKRRACQAFDIIVYLLDNNLGVFPGDQALFYALTKVFLKEFPNQMPPNWKNFTTAVKAIESRKIAVLHTHMVKTERAKLQTCTLLVRTGVDPNGIIASTMKQKMREKYPGIFVPPAFSPTPEELALLQDLDRKPTGKDVVKPNANGQKFRSRRKIEEVEVFNAPYYTSTTPATRSRGDFFWHRGYEHFVDEGPGVRKRSAHDDSSAGPLQKRAKASLQDDDGYGDIPVDPSIMGVSTLSQFGQEDGPSVLEAIKAFSLLPVKPGPRGRRGTSNSYKPLDKLPPELGRVKNPGLGSLPDGFLADTPGTTPFQFVTPEVLILEPNTNLEDEHEGADEDGESQSQAFSREGTEEILDEHEIEGCTDGTVEKPQGFEFITPYPLQPLTNGVWPNHTLGFFEHRSRCFTLQGWMPGRQWLLAQNLPYSAEEMAEKQKTQKIKLRDWVDRDYARFCSVFNQCAAWEQSRRGMSVMLGSDVAPGYIFINFSAPPPKPDTRPINLVWSEETHYNLETLPYEDLEDDDYGDVMCHEDGERAEMEGVLSPKKRRVQRPPGAKRMQGRPPKLRLAAIKTMREHTAFPRAPEDLLRDKQDDLDWSSENVRLAAFIVVTTLLGGVDRVVDWGLMLRLVPDQTISQLRHYWCALKKDRLSTIVGLTEKFRRAFLRAYEKNEVPPIDFDNVLAYDWKSLIKWTTQLDMAERRTLPSTRSALDETVTVSNVKHGNRHWMEAYYHPQRSIFNRFQDATSEALAVSLDDVPEPKPSLEMILAMSWTRSLCVTPVESYPAEAVLHKRNSLFPDRSKTEITELMLKGVDQLQRKGVLSKSSSKWTNGRSWRFNTRVLDCLEKYAQQDKFAKAVQFKQELDRAFRAGETKRVTYLTNDGMVMALLNLQANGRVRVETTGQPNVPLGHEPGNYETRKYTKKYMHFRLDIVPTESYLYDEPSRREGEHDDDEEETEEDATLADLRRRVKSARPPTQGPGGAVPVWCDVLGKVDAERWLRYLSAVLVTLASRGSMGAEDLVRTLKPIIMVFEAELIVEWASRLGLLRAQLEGSAPAVMEWWWVAVEMQRVGLAEAEAEAEAQAAELTAAVTAETGKVANGGGNVNWTGTGSVGVAGRKRKALPSGRPVKVGEGVFRLGSW